MVIHHLFGCGNSYRTAQPNPNPLPEWRQRLLESLENPLVGLKIPLALITLTPDGNFIVYKRSRIHEKAKERVLRNVGYERATNIGPRRIELVSEDLGKKPGGLTIDRQKYFPIYDLLLTGLDIEFLLFGKAYGKRHFCSMNNP